jgi:tRNA pseudouridine13 synthase
MSEAAVLKHTPADFMVRETLFVCLNTQSNTGQQYLTLRKSGYTTMEAVRLIAEQTGLVSTNITYGGLKDEDGITEQLIAVPVGALVPDTGTWELGAGEDRWLRLSHYGYGQDPLRIGHLQGNGFHLVVRNLDPDHADALAARRKINLFFLNYYDTQRFGVPGGPKRTHHVGAAMLAGDWELALRELVALRAPESVLAGRWDGSAEAFFRGLDPRNASFYLAAHASGEWNAALRDVVSRVSAGGHDRVELEGLVYYYLTDIDRILAALATASDLPYARYGFDGGEVQVHESKRPTVVQAAVSVSAAGPDESHPGRSCVEIDFHLPSGCYATAAVRQLMLLR